MCEDDRDEMSPLEAQLALAESTALGAQHNDLARRFPAQAFVSDFTGVPGITAISPTQLPLIRGGASGALTLTGVNFASTDVITGDSGLTVSASVPSSVSIVLTVSASGGASLGLHSITYNGQVIRGLVMVR